jgi:two-component system, LuxR family, sensor kinase FixL
MQMERDWKSHLLRSIAQGFFGGVALAFVTLACFSLGLDLATTAFVYLIVIVLLSLMGSFYVSAVLSIIAVAALNYFFAPPIFNFRVDEAQDTVLVAAFLLTSLIVTGLVRKAQSQTEAALEAEVALREQASLLNLTHDSIFVRDMNDVITYWNRGAEELYGWTVEEVVGRRVTTHGLLKTVFPVPLDRIDAELRRTGRWEGELVHTKADGTQVVVASRWSLLRDEGKRPLTVLETNNDVTNRKQAEEALRQAQADLAHISRVTTMGELAASLAHEVNQPIAAAVTNADACLRWLARDTPDLEEARAAATRIMKDGTRASEIINRIHLFFKKTTPKREPIDLCGVIREMIVLLRTEMARYSISIRTEVATDLPRVMGDRVQLQQVMMNLIMNSIAAMKDVDGKRELAIKAQRAQDEDLMVCVSDTGVGLPPQQADKVFNAFFTTKLDGTGMGLSISRSILESHGGRLWATDNCPRGASFHFTLPAKADGLR